MNINNSKAVKAKYCALFDKSAKFGTFVLWNMENPLEVRGKLFVASFSKYSRSRPRWPPLKKLTIFWPQLIWRCTILTFL